MSPSPQWPDDRVNLTPIGTIHSAFVQAAGAPIQPYRAEDSLGTVEIFSPYVEGLRDLEGFDRIWLVYWFHRASAARLRVTPFLDTVEHGIFATRAPARPNPIGLSSVRLIGIESNVLHIAEVDILTGTPLLDIKPNIPLYDNYPITRCGWFDRVAHDPVVADARFERSDLP